MTDRRESEITGEAIGDTLRHMFPARPELSGDFEQRVLSQVDAGVVRHARHKRLARIMLAYWAAFGIATGWVLSEAAPAQQGVSSMGVGAIAASLALVVLSALFLARQSRLKLSQLFFRTLI